MKRSTYNRIVDWHNATHAALQNPPLYRTNGTGIEKALEYSIKCAEMRTIGILLNFLKDEINE